MRKNFLLLCLAGVLWTGCATSALWEEGRFANYHQPAAPAEVKLFESPTSKDVLVSYIESREDRDTTRPRAYWLQENVSRLKAGKRPRFVANQKESALVEIPMLGADMAGAASENRTRAVLSRDSGGFVLYRAAGAEAPLAGTYYPLPVYKDASGRVKQVLLTPLTTTADLTIIGGYLCIVAWSQGGFCGVH